MAISLDNAVSSKTREKLNQKDNKPEFAEGFEGSGGSGGIFDDVSDVFAGAGTPSSGGDPFASPNSGGAMGDPFGSGGGLGASAGINMGAFGAPGFAQPPAQPPKQSAKDEFIEQSEKAAFNALTSLWKVTKALYLGLELNTATDLGEFGASSIKRAIVCGVIGSVVMIIGLCTSIPTLKITGGTMLGAGIFAASLSLALIGISALKLKQYADGMKIDDLGDIENTALKEMNFAEKDYDDLYEDIVAEASASAATDTGFDFSDEAFFGNGAAQPSSDDASGFFSDIGTLGDLDESTPAKNDTDNAEDILNSLHDNEALVDRNYLIDRLAGFFKSSTPEFGDTEMLDKDSDEYQTIRALVLEALAGCVKIDLAELEEDVDSIESSVFCYTIRCERNRALKSLTEFENELNSLFRTDDEDKAVAATITIEHGMYKIVITKGVCPVVTIGDCLQSKEIADHLRSSKKKLPFIAGIDLYGRPELADAANYTTMLIAGQQRSGKSWYVAGVLTTLMAFNTPEDENIIIIDPKESSLMQTLACLPHVIGLHTEKTAIKVFEELINIEGKKRKQILKENRCENIWDLRERKGIKIPVIHVVIDEYLSLKSNLEINGTFKMFEELLLMAITQLGSLGIYIIMIPHRAQGIVNKTVRAMIMYTVAIRFSNASVKELLDIPKWDRPLLKPGDAAINMSDVGVVKAIRGVAVADTDGGLLGTIENIAKAWYKIGADIPDYSYLTTTNNRDEDDIADILGFADNSKTKHLHNSGKSGRARAEQYATQFDDDDELGTVDSDTIMGDEDDFELDADILADIDNMIANDSDIGAEETATVSKFKDPMLDDDW